MAGPIFKNKTTTCSAHASNKRRDVRWLCAFVYRNHILCDGNEPLRIRIMSSMPSTDQQLFVRSVGRWLGSAGMYVLGSSAHRSNNALGTIGPVAKKHLFPCAFAIPFTAPPPEGREMRRACLRLCATNLYVPEMEKRKKALKPKTLTNPQSRSFLCVVWKRRLGQRPGAIRSHSIVTVITRFIIIYICLNFAHDPPNNYLWRCRRFFSPSPDSSAAPPSCNDGNFFEFFPPPFHSVRFALAGADYVRRRFRGDFGNHPLSGT